MNSVISSLPDEPVLIFLCRDYNPKYLDVIKYFILDEHWNTEVYDMNGNNLMHLAVMSRNYELVEFIYNIGISFREYNVFGETAMHLLFYLS